MKQTFVTVIALFTGFTTYCQSDSVRGKQFELKGKILNKVEETPHCGNFPWGTVVEFEVIELVGLHYSKKSIGIIITCPEFYQAGFFKKGKTYRVVFSDQNQADFGWGIPNEKLLKKNNLSFDPYAITINEIP